MLPALELLDFLDYCDLSRMRLSAILNEESLDGDGDWLDRREVVSIIVICG